MLLLQAGVPIENLGQLAILQSFVLFYPEKSTLAMR
jgi:hypothetical protein